MRSVVRAGVAGALVALLVTGCGAPGGVSSSPLPGTSIISSRSFMRQTRGSGQELLYVSTRNGIVMLTYPQGKLIGSFAANEASVYLCSDPNTGNVFVPQSGAIEEYAHGGTTPISSLKPPQSVTVGACSVDPTTGDLAVTCGGDSLKSNGVLIYKQASGQPKVYLRAKLRDAAYAAYDNDGNLFVIGYNNANRFVLNVLRVQVSGSTGIVVSSVSLNNGSGDPYYWIQDGAIVSQSSDVKKRNNIGVAIWPYPSGGNPSNVLYGITNGRKDYISDMTVSVVPGNRDDLTASHSRR